MNLEAQRDVMDLFVKSARDFLDGWYENEYIKAAFGFDAVVGNYASPDTPGSAYVLLHHVFGEVNGKKGRGGIASAAWARSRRRYGRGVRRSGRRDQPRGAGRQGAGRWRQGGRRAAGKRRGDRGAAVAPMSGRRLLYRQLVDRSDMPPEFAAGWTIQGGSGTFRMNVALVRTARFHRAAGQGQGRASHRRHHHRADARLYGRAYTDAKANGWSKEPIVEMKIPTSTVDDSLAPPGQHIASLFCQQFAPVLPDGTWDDEREAAADLIVDTVTNACAQLQGAVIARQIHSPLDLERKFGLIGGDIMHGHMSLDQLWAARPMLGHGDYRARSRGSICAARAPIRAAASPARRGTMRRTRYWPIRVCSGGCGAEGSRQI
jgi:phytoene dehydrogenase-like protein